MRVLICLVVSIFSFAVVEAEAYNVFEENGKVGLKTDDGRIVIPPTYEALGWSDGSFSVYNNVTGYKLNNSWGIISITNNRITKAEFASAQHGESILIIVSKKQTGSSRVLMGCIDTSGKEVIPFQYDGLKINSQHAIVFVKSGELYKYGLIDFNNKYVIPAQYQNIHPLGSLRFAVEDAQNKFALFTESGKALTGFIFDEMAAYEKSYSIIKQKNESGLIDRDGNWKAKAQYRSVRISDSGIIEALPYNQWQILDGQNKNLQNVIADSIVSLNNNLFALVKGDRMELVNAQFTPITSELFSTIEPFHNNKAIVKQDDQTGLISSNGTLLIECKYHDLLIDRQYVIASLRKDQWVLLDSVGNQKTTKSYESIQRFNGIYFGVKSKNYFGAINASGQEVIACVYDSILHYQEGKLVVKFRNAYGIIDMQENWVITPQPYQYELVSGDRYLQHQGSTTFLKSYDGNLIYFTQNKLQIEKDHLIEFVSTGGKWKIDFDGRIVSRQLPPENDYQKIFPESEGLRGIKRHGQYGFVDDLGRLRIANRYEDIKPFQERLAGVKILGKWGFIDHDENLVIQPVHEQTTNFENGVAIVMQKGRYGLINKKGEVILPIRYQRITRLPTKRFLLDNDGLKGLAEADGRLIMAPKFDNIIDFNNGYFSAIREGKYGLISTQGVSTIPLMYDYLGYDEFNARYLALKRSGWQKVN